MIRELEAEYGGCFVADQYGLPGVLGRIYAHTKEGFIFIIDEWDCAFRFVKERQEILLLQQSGKSRDKCLI